MRTKSNPLTLIPNLGLTILLNIVTIGTVHAIDDWEREPILYSKSQPNNPITKLQADIDTGKVTLDFQPNTGYLSDVLKTLKIPVSSQVLVFSKTSLQRSHISPKTPRAVYFNDDVYIGSCQNCDLMEISTADSKLGTVFYSLEQEKKEKPQMVRRGDSCLLCHASSQTHGVPGHLVRSVFANTKGLPILSAGSHRVDHSTPIADRWGGWYVTGTHGTQDHLGNLIIHTRSVPEKISNPKGMNVSDLKQYFDASTYLSPHSDLVALMVLDHQAEGHNLIVQASFQTTMALHFEQSLNRELKEDPKKRWESTTSRIKAACEPLVRYLLFADEAKLTAPLSGTSDFAREFEARGPFDSKGRSLRQFDLKTRMFRYPCSYLVYSESFRSLPEEAKRFVWKRIGEILSGADRDERFKHVSEADRKALREILTETGVLPQKV